MNAAVAPRPALRGACATAGCKVQHLHPVTGEPPDYHWLGNAAEPRPRWNPDVYRRAPKAADRWFRVHEIAAIAGGVSVETVRRWIRHGGLPTSRAPGGRVHYIRGRDFEAWMLQQRRVAVLPTQEPKGT